jgi:hypothetical protein
MGCDIHVHGEVKINGKWEHWTHPKIPRDYDLFTKMAGVRDREVGVTPIADPRGIPDDISEVTRFAWRHDEPDAHSASWLSGAEIDRLEEWYAKDGGPQGQWRSLCHHVIGYVFGNGWNVAEHPNDYPNGVTDARLVFWFDN